MVKISVILPIYDVEDYLEETLSCLLNQTMIDDIEVLMVDDGSTDASRYIIEKYALDYDNFHAFHKINEGQGVARNFALKHAKGEYVHFLDSDDYIPYESYETLYNLALKNDSDIIIGDVLRFGNYNVWSDSLFKHSFEGITSDIESTNLSEMQSILWDTSTSNKLYKREFLIRNNIQFPDKKIFFEDLLFSMESYIKAESIYLSKYVFYYWRFRGKKTSVTQQHTDIKNFYDRIEILKLINKLMEENELDEDLRNYEYQKWLNHDLKIFLKKLNNYPNEFHQSLIDEVNNILEFIPHDFRPPLNSYKQVLYEMVKNNDLEGLMSFAHLEDSLKNNPRIPKNLDEKYAKLIDFHKDGILEDLDGKILDVKVEGEEILIEFSENIPYIDSDYPHDTLIYLVDENDVEFSLEIRDNHMVMPLELIKDKSHLCVKLVYRCDEFKKVAFLRNKKRQVFNLNEYDIEFAVGINNIQYIDIINKNDFTIEINDVEFDGDYFIFKGKSPNEIHSSFIKNIVSFDIFEYPVEFANGEFSFKIPYRDILKGVIKKWELNFKESLNSIELLRDFYFFIGRNKILISTKRNKMVIENHIFNSIEELKTINNKINNLNVENSKLKKSNKKIQKANKKIIKSNKNINNKIEEFKSRKAIKFVDKIKVINKKI